MHARVLSAICVLLATVTVAQSMRWFAPELSCWITQKKVPASWEDAQRRCERHGAVLASPLNMQLYDYMQSLVTVHNHSVAYFIGTRANRSNDDEEVEYVSVEGRRLEDMPRAVYDTIEQLDLEQGDCLSMDRHGIRAVSCWDHLPYICYSNETTECNSEPATTQLPTAPTEPTTSTSAPTTTTTAPPPGYTHKSATGSYYKLHNRNKLTWYEANATCAREGAHVVVLNNAEEADIVQGVMRDGLGWDVQHIWTGLQYNRLKGWHTVNGEPLSEVFHKWASGYPSNREAYACTYFYEPSKQLYDYPCNNKHEAIYFVCEIPQ